MTWFEPKGEILVIQKPANNLEVEIITDKKVYSPGDLVKYEIFVKNSKTGALVTNRDVLVSLSITDDSVFG